jgi:hypothetical protein
VLEADSYLVNAFRSSGGKGIHLYLLFKTDQDAYSVREMLGRALASCGFTNGTNGVAAGEVEIYPKQDSVPDGGAMLVLPLSPRRNPSGRSPNGAPRLTCRSWRRQHLRRRAAVDAPELARLKSALAAINPDPLSYEKWRDVCFGIHNATEGSDAGLALAHEFSARSSKYDPDVLDNRVWPYINSDRGGGVITAQTIFNRALADGWQDPAVADEFDVLEAEETAVAVASGRPAFISEIAFAQQASPAWFVKGVLPKADVVVIYGESTSGKSFFALDLATCLARGEAWRGHKIPSPVRVQRVRAQHVQRGVPAAGRDVTILADAPSLLDRRAVDDLIARAKPLGKLDIMIIDTFAAVTPGPDENAAGQMGQVVEHCKVLRRALGATIVLLHHLGKDDSKGMRGSSSIHAAADCVLKITRVGKTQDRIAKVEKQKGGVAGAEFGFRFRSCRLAWTMTVMSNRRAPCSTLPPCRRRADATSRATTKRRFTRP